MGGVCGKTSGVDSVYDGDTEVIVYLFGYFILCV